jgi:hypothetical protein
MKAITWLAAFALLIAGSALGQTWTRAPDGTGGSCGTLVTPGKTCYLKLTSSAATDSPFIFLTRYGDVEFDPKLDGTGTSAAQVTVEKCTGGATYANRANMCETVCVDVDGNGPVDNGILDGDTGESSGSQRRYIYDLGPGLYYIATPTDPNAADTAVVTLRGHN